MPDDLRPHYDCIGIGVGPANLSLASLLSRHSDDVSHLFLDRRAEFGWHDGQQLAGSSLQVSMLKDLVSLADPANPYSFLSYLHARGRIYHFLNAQFDAVPRQEFRDYLKWACDRNENVVFKEEVRSVGFDGDFTVRTDRRTLRARNISVGVGTQPWVPAAARPDEHQFHVSEFAGRAVDLAGKRVCVVGGGQSGAEAFLDLISRPRGERPRRTTWVSRRRNFFPIDDSPFTNDFFMPSWSDHFFGLERSRRENFNNQHVLASDGISERTLRDIYQRLYTLGFIQDERELVALFPHTEVVDVVPGNTGTGMKIALSHLDDPTARGTVDADLIVWATGFRPASTAFLDPLAHRFEREGDEIRVDESFAVRWNGPADRAIFLHNAVPQQRGLPDRNLSLIAWRSKRIVDRLRGVRSDEPLASFLEWSTKPDVPEVVLP